MSVGQARPWAGQGLVPGRVVKFARTLMGARYALTDEGEVWAWGENDEHGIPGRTEHELRVPAKILP